MEDYWTVSSGVAVRNGWSCRECRRDVFKGEPIFVRDGRKLRLFYHARCFSGTADPRTQDNSSYKEWRHTIADQAPKCKGRGKWSVSSYGYDGHLSTETTPNSRPPKHSASSLSSAGAATTPSPRPPPKYPLGTQARKHPSSHTETIAAFTSPVPSSPHVEASASPSVRNEERAARRRMESGGGTGRLLEGGMATGGSSNHTS